MTTYIVLAADAGGEDQDQIAPGDHLIKDCPWGPSDRGLHCLPVGEACGGCLGFWDF